MSSMMTCWCQPSTLQPTNLAIPRISNGSREFSGQRLMLHLSGDIDNLIKSAISTVFMFFCFLPSLSSSLRVLMIKAKTEGTSSIWASLFWMVSFTIILTLPVSVCLGDVITNLFWRQNQGTNFGGRSTFDTDFPTHAPQSIGLCFCWGQTWMVWQTQLVWDKPGCRTVEETYTLSSSDWKTFKCESFEVAGTLL